MTIEKYFIYLAVMAGVTYLIRALPLAICRSKVKNKFVKSFLAYIPYAVLSAMTFPAVIYSTGRLVSGIVGTVVGIFLSYKRKSLLTVAVAACVAAFIAGLL